MTHLHRFPYFFHNSKAAPQKYFHVKLKICSYLLPFLLKKIWHLKDAQPLQSTAKLFPLSSKRKDNAGFKLQFQQRLMCCISAHLYNYRTYGKTLVWAGGTWMLMGDWTLSVPSSLVASVDGGHLIVHWELFTFLQKLHLVSPDKVE